MLPHLETLIPTPKVGSAFSLLSRSCLTSYSGTLEVSEPMSSVDIYCKLEKKEKKKIYIYIYTYVYIYFKNTGLPVG